MKTNPEPEREDALLDAVLGDEPWQAANATFKATALAAFHARQRRRRLTRWTAGTLALAAAALLATHTSRRPTPNPVQVAISQEIPKPAPIHYASDAELLASFPEGSCFLAEIDGKKELIFLDPNVERVYLAGAAPAN